MGKSRSRRRRQDRPKGAGRSARRIRQASEISHAQAKALPTRPVWYVEGMALDEMQRCVKRIGNAEADLVDAVTAARELGVTWERIGRALGVTRQAAQKRFGA